MHLRNSYFISVIIPYYNKAKFVKKTLNSLFNQSYKNFEVIIVYDDDKNLSDLFLLRNIIKNKKNFKIFVNKKKLGAGFSRNIGIKKSKGDFICFLDADDIWKKNKLREQVEFMKKNNLLFCHTNYYLINEKSFIYGLIKAKKIITYDNLFNSCDIGLSTVMIKKEFLSYNEFSNLKTKEDYQLWLTLAKKGIKIFGLNKNLVFWRKTNNSLSSFFLQKLFDAFKIYRIYENKNIIFSLFLVIRLSLYALQKKLFAKFYKVI
jgi:teichuronic acid biosynthesis glycosyltransferase TuaG